MVRKLLLVVFACLVSCDCRKEIVWEVTEPEDWEKIGFGGEGEVEWTDGVLSLATGVELTGVSYKGDAPEMPYELQFEARKIRGSDFFCGLTFPVSSKEECVTLIVDGWGGGTVGISSVDGMDASENETTTFHRFDEGKWYGIRVMVEEGQLSVFIDDEQVVDLKTEGRELAMRSGPIEACMPLGFATWQTASEVRNLRWRSLAD